MKEYICQSCFESIFQKCKQFGSVTKKWKMKPCSVTVWKCWNLICLMQPLCVRSDNLWSNGKCYGLKKPLGICNCKVMCYVKYSRFGHSCKRLMFSIKISNRERTKQVKSRFAVETMKRKAGVIFACSLQPTLSNYGKISEDLELGRILIGNSRRIDLPAFLLKEIQVWAHGHKWKCVLH